MVLCRVELPSQPLLEHLEAVPPSCPGSTLESPPSWHAWNNSKRETAGGIHIRTWSTPNQKVQLTLYFPQNTTNTRFLWWPSLSSFTNHSSGHQRSWSDKTAMFWYSAHEFHYQENTGNALFLEFNIRIKHNLVRVQSTQRSLQMKSVSQGPSQPHRHRYHELVFILNRPHRLPWIFGRTVKLQKTTWWDLSQLWHWHLFFLVFFAVLSLLCVYCLYACCVHVCNKWTRPHPSAGAWRSAHLFLISLHQLQFKNPGLPLQLFPCIIFTFWSPSQNQHQLLQLA